MDYKYYLQFEGVAEVGSGAPPFLRSFSSLPLLLLIQGESRLGLRLELSSSADRIFLEYQNRFRGIAAAFKSKRFVEKRASTPARTFRSEYRHLLLDARVHLEEEQFGPYLDWTAHLLETQLPELSRTPVAYDELAGVYDSPDVSLDRELKWISHRIRTQFEKISTFRSLVYFVEALVADGRYEDAIEALSAIDTAFGVSMWGVQLRIALEQFAGGLERQKRYTSSVRAIYKRGLLSFIAYHTSVRNEDKSTPGKFIDHILGRIERHSIYSDDVKSYLRYKLAGIWGDEDAKISQVLKVEQNHHIFDLYETFISCAQKIVRQGEGGAGFKSLRECIQTLPAERDFRLAKIALRLGIFNAPLPPRQRDVSDPLLSGDVLGAARSYAAKRATSDVDVWNILYGGVALSFAPRGALPAVGPENAGRILAAALKDRAGAHEALEQLGKLAANLRGLPFGAGLGDLLGLLDRQSPSDPWRPWLLALNSPTHGIEDLTPEEMVGIKPQSATEKVWLELSSPSDGAPASTAVALFRSAGQLFAGNPAAAVAGLTCLHNASAGSPLFSLTSNLLLSAKMALSDRSGIVELLASAATERAEQKGLLPIRATLEGLVFDDFQALAAPLAAPIALHMLWEETERDITRSQLRFATGAALRACGVSRPSEIGAKSALPIRQLIYFLSKVCKPDVLDVLRAIKSTRATLEERHEILRLLRELQPDGPHGDELMQVARDLTMVEGQWIVDHTRIHVDTVALRRWADRELSEDFDRYQDLVGVDVGPQPSFDEVLKELATATARKLAPPETEADAVLHDMIRRLGDEFLNSGVFGLDFYLSKRIRHQSFIGRIRGPLEFAHLITTRETESSPYHRNTHWLNRFETASPEQLDAVNSALEGCARDFDEILRDAKDRLFHIKSPENPDGLLYLSLTAPFVQLVKSISLWSPDDFGAFYEITVAMLWSTLEPSLLAVRQHIGTDLKAKITQRLELARAEVRSAVGQDPAYHDFDIEFGTRSTEVQRALDDAATWFTFTQVEQMRRTFTLEDAVKIGRDNALRCQRGFEPRIETEVQGGVEITAPGLVIIHDTMFIALDNIRAHSGEKSPRADIKIAHDRDLGTLTIEVVSDCKPAQRSKAERALRDIQGIIEGGVPTRRTKKEGGSGLLKLDAVVRQSPKGRLDFGFVQGDRFRLSVTYSFNYEAPHVEAAAA